MLNALYLWLPRIFGCHCRSDRSFYYKGRKFPLCARCTGELAGILMCFVLFCFWKPPLLQSVIMMLPLVIDGFIQLLTKYESTNIKRLITGIMFGIGFPSFVIRTHIVAYNYGIDLGQYIKGILF